MGLSSSSSSSLSLFFSLLPRSKMTFYCNLFDWLRTDSWASYGLILVSFFYLALFYQQMERRRSFIEVTSETPLFRANDLIGCFLTFTAVMSSNGGVMVAMLLGTIIEFWTAQHRDGYACGPRPLGISTMHSSPSFRAPSATNFKDAFPVAPACNSFSLSPPTPPISGEFAISGSVAVSSGRRPGFQMKAPEFDDDDDYTYEASNSVAFQMSAPESWSSFSPVLGPAAHHHPRYPLPPLEFLENKVAAQAAEMQRIARENRGLAGTHAALRQELFAIPQKIAFQQKREKIYTDCDIQMGEIIEKNRPVIEFIEKLQQSHQVAHSLISEWQNLTAEFQHIIEEWQKTTDDIKKVQAELDMLRQEHQMLRVAFEYEKGSNMEQVERLQAMEKKLVSMARRMQAKLILMAREAEKLRAEVANAEEIASAAIQQKILPSRAPSHLLSQPPSNGFQFGASANTMEALPRSPPI